MKGEAARLLALAALALCLWPTTGCGPRETPAAHGARHATLLVGNAAEPQDLDPQATSGESEAYIHYALFEGLVSLDTRTLDVLPGVATHWECSPDGRVWTFHLRPEARWSNGDPLTSHDFAFAYRRILTPEFGAPYASSLFLLAHAKAYYQNPTDFGQVGLRTPDAHTLVLTLEHPTPYFLSGLAHPSWYPVHPPTLLKHDAQSRRGTRWTRPGEHVGNGPFRLVSWKLASAIEVERNPYYWDADRVALDKIVFFPIADPETEARAFRAGQLHLTYNVPSSRLSAWKDSPALRLDPDFGLYYYLLNVSRPPLDNPLVRRALAMSIDRQAITTHIRQRNEQPALSMTPTGIGDYLPPDVLKEDPAAARALLAEAGFPQGRGFPPLTLLYNDDQHRQIAVAVQRLWQENLGISVTLEKQEWKVYLETRRRGDFQIARAGWLGDYYDPNTFLEVWRSSSPYNHSRWAHAEYDALLAQAAAETDPTRRNALFAEAETLLMNELPFIPVFFYNRAFLIHPAVRGWQANLLNFRRYQELQLDPAAAALPPLP